MEVIDLSGKLTLGQGDSELLKTVERLLQDGAQGILINLDQVPYMDSAGIGVLVTCCKRAVERGARVKLLNPRKRVFDLLHLVKLDTIFEVFHEEPQAIASFAAGEGL